MMKRSTSYVLITSLAAGLFLFTRPAKGQFGLPSIVFDPTTAADVLKDVAVALKIYSIERQAQEWFRYKGGWQMAVTQAVPMIATQNRFGETTGWGSGSSAGWYNATVRLAPTVAMTRNPAALADLASVEILDQAATQARQTRTQTAPTLAQSPTIIQNLQTSILDTAAGSNSQVQQLNLISAAGLQALQMHQVTTTVQGAEMDLQVAQAKIQRDQIAAHLQFESDVDAAVAQQGIGLGSMSQSIQSWQPK